jgi:antitoxin MazE
MPAIRKTKSMRSEKRKRAGKTTPLLVRNSKVARWGNSLAFRIPQVVADRLRLTDGGQVSVEMEADSFTVRPVRKKWSESELLQGVTPEMVDGEIDWGDSVGKEV